MGLVRATPYGWMYKEAEAETEVRRLLTSCFTFERTPRNQIVMHPSIPAVNRTLASIGDLLSPPSAEPTDGTYGFTLLFMGRKWHLTLELELGKQRQLQRIIVQEYQNDHKE